MNKSYTKDLMTDTNGDASIGITFDEHISTGVYILRANSASGHLQAKLVVD
ncbi:hypothetical protein MKJ04_20940 [Pontibacter sp. E15-1]|uniref:hypothetical protein n=1 Tax=Pontibacter sp. E15-1 TaxID=2919918 RepID=UPI001F502C40|nr:hypothetical protein [Pontibacter sp. E15-1]MCJ8167320.1 hypothetical protein [Pontibacter sp. E15-1]